MEPQFWHEKWEKNQTGFHLSEVNPLLSAYYEALGLKSEQTVFLPLCGKTLDIVWLREQGLKVIGVELHEPAVKALFDGMASPYSVTDDGPFLRYSAEGVTVFVGDFFALTPERIGYIDALYDRASIVALPQEMRVDYVSHLKALAGQAKQLLINYEYDQSVMSGPPFSVSNIEITDYYKADYSMTQLYHGQVEGGLKGRYPATENVWLIAPQNEFS